MTSEAKQNREELIRKLQEKYKIKKGKRFVYSKRQAWYLTVFERIAARRIERYLKKFKSVLIGDVYALRELRVIWPRDSERAANVKYLLMLLKSMNLIKVKCNNGYKVIAWNREKERRMKHEH